MTSATILGCGYVGQAVARIWQSKYALTVTTTRPDRVNQLSSLADRVQVVHSADDVSLRSLLSHTQILLVAVGAPNRTLYEPTYLGTAKALARILPDCSMVNQVIYTSSYAVYGDQDGAWVDETSPIDPANQNGEILAEAERILLGAAHESLQVCVFRLGGIYGPGRELLKIFRSAAGTTRPGTGSDWANWVHLEDIGGAIEIAATQRLNGLYNLVGDHPMQSKELLDRLCQAHQLEPIRWDSSQPSTRPYNARVSNEKLRLAGYQFRYPTIDVYT